MITHLKRRAGAAALLSRILAGIAGGYVLTYAAAACLSLLPAKPASGVFLTASLAPLVMIGAVIGAFAARNATRAWAGLLLPALLLGGLALLMKENLG